MKCEICKEVEIGEPVYCCDGWMCGCQGKSIDPPWCYECHVKLDSKEVLPK